MNAIIVCGGLSTRLGETTKSIPKVLLPVGPKRVIDWQVEKLKAAGCDTIVLAAGHLSQVLRQEVGDVHLGVKMIHAVEPEKLGTGGAIKFAWQYVPNPDQPTIVVNGDILGTFDLSDMINRRRDTRDGIILGAKVEDAATYGTLEMNDQHELQAFKEKEGKHEPAYINGGYYLFNPSIRSYFPAESAFSLEYDVFPNVSKLDVFVSDEPWIDIGVPERYAWAQEHWKEFSV